MKNFWNKKKNKIISDLTVSNIKKKANEVKDTVKGAAQEVKESAESSVVFNTLKGAVGGAGKGFGQSIKKKIENQGTILEANLKRKAQEGDEASKRLLKLKETLEDTVAEKIHWVNDVTHTSILVPGALPAYSALRKVLQDEYSQAQGLEKFQKVQGNYLVTLSETIGFLGGVKKDISATVSGNNESTNDQIELVMPRKNSKNKNYLSLLDKLSADASKQITKVKDMTTYKHHSNLQFEMGQVERTTVLENSKLQLTYKGAGIEKYTITKNLNQSGEIKND